LKFSPTEAKYGRSCLLLFSYKSMDKYKISANCFFIH